LTGGADFPLSRSRGGSHSSKRGLDITSPIAYSHLRASLGEVARQQHLENYRCKNDYYDEHPTYTMTEKPGQEKHHQGAKAVVAPSLDGKTNKEMSKAVENGKISVPIVDASLTFQDWSGSTDWPTGTVQGRDIHPTHTDGIPKPPAFRMCCSRAAFMLRYDCLNSPLAVSFSRVLGTILTIF
jgi:hypothetical protein